MQTSFNGPWMATNQLPAGMSQVPANANFTSLKGYIPPAPGSTAAAPAVYYSATPA